MTAQIRTPLVSIALCTYNGESYINQQIESLLAQTYPNFEIIIVDDNSTDGTLAACEFYKNKDGRIRLLKNEVNIGFNKNFKTAISACTGEFVAPCDQDDIWHPDKIKKLIESIGDQDLSYSDSELIDESGNPLNCRISTLRRMYQGKNPLAFLLTNCISGHAMLARKSLLLSIEIPDELYYDWWIAIAACSRNGIAYVDEPLVMFRRHSAASSGIASKNFDGSVSVSDFLNEKKSILSWIVQLNGRSSHDAKRMLESLSDKEKIKSKLILAATFTKNIWAIFYIHSKNPVGLMKKTHKLIFKRK